MFVFLDVNKKEIKCYGEKGTTIVPFRDISILSSIVGKEEIYYITNAVKTDTIAILNLIGSLGYQIEESAIQEQLSNDKYIHSAINGTVMIDEELRFDNFYDIRIYDENMEKKAQTSPILKALLKSGKVRIINEIEKNILLKEYKKAITEDLRKEKLRDEELDKIVMKKKIDKENPIVDDDDDDDDDDNIISIDLSSDTGGARKIGGVSLPSENMTSMAALMAEFDNMNNEG